ncbi:MAG TPA: serine--tRNA ligase, partial [Rhodospirillaceae bacterium]|nr:serine--tRNA ligase [Rhodospirillaceae bacterium]
MHDIKWIREEPAALDKAMARRGLPAPSPEILKLDSERRAAQTAMQ